MEDIGRTDRVDIQTLPKKGVWSLRHTIMRFAEINLPTPVLR